MEEEGIEENECCAKPWGELGSPFGCWPKDVVDPTYCGGRLLKSQSSVWLRPSGPSSKKLLKLPAPMFWNQSLVC